MQISFNDKPLTPWCTKCEKMVDIKETKFIAKGSYIGMGRSRRTHLECGGDVEYISVKQLRDKKISKIIEKA